MDARYLEPAIEAWLDTVSSECAAFRDRRQVLDCAEFPCMLMVEVKDARGEREASMSALTCGLAEGSGPDAKYMGFTGGPGNFFHLWSFRPPDAYEYSHREFVRSTKLMPPPVEAPE